MNEALSRLLAMLPVGARGDRADYDALAHEPAGEFLPRLADVPQEAQWHGEGDVLAHTKLVCERLLALEDFWALSLERRQMLYLAAMLHDIGKIPCTRMEDGRLTAPGHSQTGAQMARSMLTRAYDMGADRALLGFRETVCLLIRYHMAPEHVLERENPERYVRGLAANGELAEGFTLRMLCLLAKADCLGRIADDAAELADSVELCAALAQECGCYDGPYAFPSAHVQHAYLSGRGVMPDQPLYDDTWNGVVMLCGLPGTGKDTYIAAQYPGLPMLSLDELRRAMSISPQEDQGRVAQAAKEKAREYLRAKRRFVFNATNITPDLRGKWLRLFEQYGAATEIVYLETGWAERRRRNADRRYAVPEAAVGRMLEKLTPPERQEGTSVRWLCV